MTTVLGIDPGKDQGWAIVSDGTLLDCGLGEPRFGGRIFNLAVIEKPRIYNSHTQRARPDDIITLAISVGRVYERLVQAGIKSIELIKPSEWKGSINADICTARILAGLTDKELAILSYSYKGSKSKQHNVIDAIGIAKWGHRHYAMLRIARGDETF